MNQDELRQQFSAANSFFVGLRGQQQTSNNASSNMNTAAATHDDASPFPLFARRPSFSILNAVASPRRSSLLGLSMQVSGDQSDQGVQRGSDDTDMMRDDLEDAPMTLGSPIPSPAFELPAFIAPSRRRSESIGNNEPFAQPGLNSTMSTSMPASSINVPPSPLSIARVLQDGQRTPPPFLQRRLFNENSSSSEPQSSQSPQQPHHHHHHHQHSFASTLAHAHEASGSGGGGSNSGSGGEESYSSSSGRTGDGGSGVKVVKRPINRRPNLLPKPKSHLRVLTQLRQEDQPGDSLEIASEATLHRLARSQASTLPPARNHGGSSSASKSTPNRYPEQAEEDVFDRPVEDESSNDDDENGSDLGMSVGYGTEDEEERKVVMWNGIRSGGSTPSALLLGKSPGSEKAFSRMEVEMPSTPSWQGSRPGKRKLGDERFEPYSQAFKRRAVSPASSNHFPTPPSLTSLPATLPMSMPSPTLAPIHINSYWNAAGQGNISTGSVSGASAGSRSRAGSPVPSLSSSAGTRMSFFVREREKEEKEREKLESLGKMTLG